LGFDSIGRSRNPPGDRTLIPLRDQALEWIASQEYETRFIRRPKTGPDRIHGSVDGNAIFAILTLELSDPRMDVLIGHLLNCQWPDGGWNCDRKAKGETSSFDETLICFRALALLPAILRYFHLPCPLESKNPRTPIYLNPRTPIYLHNPFSTFHEFAIRHIERGEP
jgi:hypothetical protein